MPTIFRYGPYRFYFYSHDVHEPAHVHVDAAGSTAKLWLSNAAVAYNDGFRAPQLSEIKRLIRRNQAHLLEAWNEYFGK